MEKPKLVRECFLLHLDLGNVMSFDWDFLVYYKSPDGLGSASYLHFTKCGL